jgi:branched-chain amino acid transport system substrate-binding protein
LRYKTATTKGGGMRTSAIGALRIVVAIFSLAGVIAGLSAAPASASTGKAPILIGFISDETGPSSSSYINAVEGAQARIDAQNAAGGVNGHKLEIMAADDTGTPTGFSTAAHLLVSKGVFGIISDASVTFGASRYLQQQGMPVVGAAVDGPEWGQQPNSNMFAIADLYSTSPFNGYYYTYTFTQAQLKALHITKLAQIVFNVPAAIDAANTIFQQANAAGISKCLDALVPSSGNLNPTVLQIKNLGCNGVEVLSTLSTCITLATDLKQADLKTKVICSTGYDQTLLDQPTALAAMQGSYTTSALNVLGSDVNSATKLFLSRLKKYTAWAGGIPSENIDYAYESADVMINGLTAAGANPTRKAFISAERKVTNYTVEGMYTTPFIFAHFGTLGMLPKKSCSPLLEIKGKSFVPAYNTCGTLVRGAKA